MMRQRQSGRRGEQTIRPCGCQDMVIRPDKGADEVLETEFAPGWWKGCHHHPTVVAFFPQQEERFIHLDSRATRLP